VMELGLIGLTAIHISAKFEEIRAPAVHDLLACSSFAHSKADVIDMERRMLSTTPCFAQMAANSG